MLKLSLFTKCAGCHDIISVELYHFTNFDGTNKYYMGNEQKKVLVLALIDRRIQFEVCHDFVTINESQVRVRLDAVTKKTKDAA